MHGDQPNKAFTGQLIDWRQLRGIQSVLLECKLTMDCQHGIAGGKEKTTVYQGSIFDKIILEAL